MLTFRMDDHFHGYVFREYVRRMDIHDASMFRRDCDTRLMRQHARLSCNVTETGLKRMIGVLQYDGYCFQGWGKLWNDHTALSYGTSSLSFGMAFKIVPELFHSGRLPMDNPRNVLDTLTRVWNVRNRNAYLHRT